MYVENYSETFEGDRVFSLGAAEGKPI